jgi:glycosyltransferase involved in cell wall biosynthesis
VKKKKLLIVTGIYPPDIGGPATYVSAIVKDLEKDFDVEVLTLGEEKSTEKLHYISRKEGFFSRSHKIKRFIQEHNYEVIFCQSPFSVGFGVARAKTKAKIVHKIVGDNVWEIGQDILGVREGIDEFQKKKLRKPGIMLMRTFQRTAAKRGDQIIVPSEYLKKLVSRWGVKEDKIIVIRNAIKDLDVKLAKKETVRKELRLKKKTTVSVARLAPWKGMETLIEIFKKRKEENLIIIGDGALLEKLKKLSKGYPNIQVKGRLPRKETLKYIKASDQLILNSGYEGLPHVVLEAFELETLVLASNTCGNPEIVIEGKTGFLFEYEHKKSIQEALKRAEKADKEKITKNAKSSLDAFKWGKMIKETIEVIKK